MMAGEFVTLLDDVWDELRADPDPRFDPPYSTVQANMISGGTAVNILAREALVTWEYRALPDRDRASPSWKRVKRRTRGGAAAEICPPRAGSRASRPRLHAAYPGLVMDENSPAIALAREITGANRVEAVAYGTEAGHFQSYGIPAVICGPGSIDQAHKPDEFCGLQRICRLRSLPAQGDRQGERVTALRPAPALLQIFRERLKPDAEAAYGRTEERIARFCAEHECPNRYLALVAIGSPREVWWLNEFSSRAELERVTAFYAENRGVTEAMQELARGKAVSTEKPIDLLTSFRPVSQWRE